ncbi:DUF7426 family protein [Aeromicrobium phragmitis]|uniref:DUF7426 family protein n=1 Tax=Aeromicrobium phragmitis TaxID=2478914 RepID=UPI00140737A4|nr:hypothetical protein [Aeromicrobium phragmitis]
MSQFKDLDDFFDPTLRLPIRGKEYVIQPVDAATGVWVQRLFEVGVRLQSGDDVEEAQLASLKLDDAEERDTFRRVLGDTYDEMVADNVPWPYIKHAGTTTLIWIATDKDRAEAYWSAGGERPKARKAPADRQAKSARPASTATKKAPAKKPRASAKSSSNTGR